MTIASLAPGRRPRRRRSRSASVVATALAAAALALAGCGNVAPSGSGPATFVAPSVAVPSPSAPSPAGSSTPTASRTAVAADPSLLTIASSDGISLTYDAETTAQVAADPSLASSATALAIGLALPATSGGPSAASLSADLAVVSVIRLRDPAADEGWFRGWRDSYDDAACANAGGVTRRAETQIAGRTVHIGSCAGGSFTYHVRLDTTPVVISLTSIGPGRLGERIMAGLTP